MNYKLTHAQRRYLERYLPEYDIDEMLKTHTVLELAQKAEQRKVEKQRRKRKKNRKRKR